MGNRPDGSAIPVLIVVFVLKEQFVAGLTLGATKG